MNIYVFFGGYEIKGERLIRLLVPILPLSLNKMANMHWAERARHKDLIRKYLFVELIETGQGDKKFEVPVKVSITVWRKRRLDQDNAIGGLKPWIDSLRGLGLIVNDSPRWLTIELKQFAQKDADRWGTEIIITPMNQSKKSH